MGRAVMADRMQPLKLGFIGCGVVTERGHLPALRSLPAAEVVAVADIDPDRLQRVANRFHIEHRCADFLALIEDPTVEVVAVCVPAQFHVQVALAVLDAGKHLFIEKPLALDLDESDRLIRRAAQSPSKIMVGFNLRWHRLVRQARALIRQGTLGPSELVRTALTSGAQYRENVPEWRKRRALGGGEFLETAVHYFDLWRFLLQTEVEEVFATSRSEQWDDETAVVTARLANGVLATSIFSTRTSNSNEVEIYGQAGRLSLSLLRFGGLEFFSAADFPGSIRTRLRKITRVLTALPQTALRMRRGGDFIASYRTEWRHFIDSIQQDTPVECTLEDGRRALQVALAAVESASRGKPVKVAQAARKVTPIPPRSLALGN